MSDLPPDTAWAPGYRVGAVLRQGTRARVVRATRVTSGAEVVLKALAPEAGQAEIGHLRTLDGVPGVVPLLDAGTTSDGAVFLAQPYYPDGSFGEMLAKRGPAPVPEAVAVARSVAAALGAVHGRGLVHNDVCPGNVLRAGRTPVLTGFGAVRAVGEALPPPRPDTESFLHSSPEALRGQARGPASDVYQLASTIWTLLAGRAPFASTDGSPFQPKGYAQRVLSEDVPPLTRADVSRSMRRILTRAMAKDPQERYASAAEFAAALEKARTARPASPASGAQTSMRSTAAPSGPQLPPSPPPSQAPVAPAPDVPPADSVAPAPVPPAPDVPLPPVGSGPSPVPETAPPPQRAVGSEVRPRPASRSLPTPEERERHETARQEKLANGTADLMMARLRGEELSPLRAWSRLEGWTGTTDSADLPSDRVGAEVDDDPAWDSDTPDRRPPRWRRQMHLALVVGGSLAVTSLASAFAATNAPAPVVAAAGNEEAAAPPSPAEEDPETVAEPSPLPEPSPASGVTLVDNLGAVELTWTDHTGGSGSYFVLGGVAGSDPVTLARTGPGAVTAQIVTENTQAEYCFTVIAVDGSAAPAPEVCTTRAADRAAAEAQAEEEAAAEEEEDDAAPSPSPSPNGDE